MHEIAKRKVVLLGATGSIGGSALRVLRAHADRLQLVGVAAHSNYEGLAGICHEFSIPHATLSCEKSYKKAQKARISLVLLDRFAPHIPIANQEGIRLTL